VEFSAAATNSFAPSGYLSRIETEMRVINSADMMLRVIEDLQLDKVWGKKYNNGESLSLHDASMMLNGRMDVFVRPGTQKIRIRAYGDNPTEPAQIANSIARAYCNIFTKSRGISARIVAAPQSPAKVVHAHLLFEIPRILVRSSVAALLAAGAAWGFAMARIRILRMPPPIPSEEKTQRRFQKY